jgi:hypothetical protein
MDWPFAYLLRGVTLSHEAYYIPFQSYDYSVYTNLGSEKSYSGKHFGLVDNARGYGQE